MVAPAVVSVIATVCVVVYVPEATENAGVAATGYPITYVAFVTLLGDWPEAAAMACSVSLLLTDNGLKYFVEEVVGVLPSVV